VKLLYEEEAINKVTNNKLSLDDFLMLNVIGKGSYGKVLLVRKKEDQNIYAMKILKKKNMIKRKQVDHINTERKIMEVIDNQFIVKLRYAFQTNQKLYLVTDYCPGGELFYHIQKVGKFNEEAAKFYAAQLVLAIEHLHKNNIVYRDLKPENVLIDKEGYIKITDFGLSKQNILDNHSANSFCGTPEYLAPEIIENSGHGKAVDWWSLGAIIYEMLTGLPPFYSKERETLFSNIKKVKIEYPKYLSKKAVSLFQDFFVRDPDKRLGAKGTDEIKSHPFFDTVNWKYIDKKLIKSPFKPRLRGDAEPLYIDDDFKNMSPTDSCGESVEKDENHLFSQFSYDHEMNLEKELRKVAILDD